MTLLSRLGYTPSKDSQIVVPKTIRTQDISIVVPVKDNQKGIDKLLSTFTEIHRSDRMIREVIIVDNLSKQPIRLDLDYPFKVILTTCKSVGPAAARNKGAAYASGKWLLFIDSDCTPTNQTVSGYTSEMNTHVAYAGNVNVITNNSLSNYYKTQETLIPPKAHDNLVVRPDYLVTANCLVLKCAFDAVMGFDESFKQAGGEDIDLAFRLLRIGTLAYQWNSSVYHSFNDGFYGFINRFHRYGKGNRQLAKKYSLNLRPGIFIPEEVKPTNIGLAFLQFLVMTLGYRKKHLTRNSIQLAHEFNEKL